MMLLIGVNESVYFDLLLLISTKNSNKKLPKIFHGAREENKDSTKSNKGQSEKSQIFTMTVNYVNSTQNDS